MKNMILLFFLFSTASNSLAEVMGKDRGGGNAAVAEFVQIMNISLDLLAENPDRPLLKATNDIPQFRAILVTMELAPLPGWGDFSYYQKVQAGLEQLFLQKKIDTLAAKTNSLILAVYLEQLTTQTLEKVLTCSRATKMPNPDGTLMKEIITVSLPPTLAAGLRSAKGLQKSVTVQATSKMMAWSISSSTSLIVKKPHQYSVLFPDKDNKPSEMRFEVVDSEIRGDYILRFNNVDIMTMPLEDCHWE
jgi:hypothetical protein